MRVYKLVKATAVLSTLFVASACTPPTAIPTTSSAVETVIAGLEDSTNYCTESLTESRVDYEACLIIQGSLGLWIRGCSGLEECEKAEIDSLRDHGNYRGLYQAAMRDPEFHGYLALAITNTVPILSSTLLRSYFLYFEPGFQEPGIDAEVCLIVRHGVCGNHVAVALALAEQSGLEARDIDFYMTKNQERLSHTMMEVWIQGEWRLYDTTFGAYWPQEPASAISSPLTSVRSGASREQNASLLPHIKERDYLDFLLGEFSVVKAEEGIVYHSFKGVEDFSERPNYVGWSTPRGPEQANGIQHSFQVPHDWSEIEIFVNGTVGSDLQLCVSSTGCKVPQENATLTFMRSGNFENEVIVTLSSSDDIAYVTLDKVMITVADG